MLGEKRSQRCRIECAGLRRKDLDRIEAEFSRRATCARQVVPEDERPAAGFGHQADRDAGSNHAWSVSECSRVRKNSDESAGRRNSCEFRYGYPWALAKASRATATHSFTS